MEILLKRITKSPNYTLGELFINGIHECSTLEDPDRGLTDSMSESEIKSKKIYGNTAIPTGTYKVDMNTVSPKFSNRSWAKPYGGKLPRLQNVKGYEGVLIHPLNRPEETLGCIGPAEKIVNGVGMNSTKAFNKIMTHLLRAKANNENISITIQ